jgi:hypothetical protein
MNNNQPNVWRSLGFMLALAFILGLSAYLTLTAAAAHPKYVLPLEHWRQPVNFINVTPITTQAAELSQLTPATTTLSYTVYLPLIFNPLGLVDNFDDRCDPNALGGYSSFFWYSPCPQTISGDCVPNGYNNSPYSYRLQYNVTPICYGGWQTDIRDLNFSGFSTLTFWIRGASGGEKAHIYLQDSDDCQLTACRHFAKVSATTGWQQARIPLSIYAANGVNLTKLRFFQVVFEWDNMAGTVYIDEIRFQ